MSKMLLSIFVWTCLHESRSGHRLKPLKNNIVVNSVSVSHSLSQSARTIYCLIAAPAITSLSDNSSISFFLVPVPLLHPFFISTWSPNRPSCNWYHFPIMSRYFIRRMNLSTAGNQTYQVDHEEIKNELFIASAYTSIFGLVLFQLLITLSSMCTGRSARFILFVQWGFPYV